MTPTRPKTRPAPCLGAGLSGHHDASTAARQAAEFAAEQLNGHCDVAFAFFSQHHLTDAPEVARITRRALDPRHFIGVSVEAVLGGETELEDSPGVAVLAAQLPGVRIVPFTSESLLEIDEQSPGGMDRLAKAFGAEPDLRATFLFADPFSTPLTRLLPAMCRARVEGKRGRIVGGMASAAKQPGGNAMLLDDTLHNDGAVGVSLLGDVRIDAVVSQGCRAVGPNMVITRAQKNVILELGGRPAVTAVEEALHDLDEQERELLRGGLLIGRVIDEYKERFGRDDYLIRNIIGVDKESGAIAVGDLVRTGQTVRLHVRDAQTADEDLALLLDAQKLHDPPAGALLVTCNGRGQRFFGTPHHDASAVSRAFAPSPAGQEKAKSGTPITDRHGPIPLAGFFGAGELGPIGDRTFLHGQTASLTLFRAPEPERDDG